MNCIIGVVVSNPLATQKTKFSPINFTVSQFDLIIWILLGPVWFHCFIRPSQSFGCVIKTIIHLLPL